MPAADHRQEMRRTPAVDVEQRDDVEDDVVLGRSRGRSGPRGCAGTARDGSSPRPSAGPSCRSCRTARPRRSRRCRGGADLTSPRRAGLRTRGRRSDPVSPCSPSSWTKVGPRGEARRDGLDERREVAVEEDDLRGGVAEDVLDLVRRQADVDRVEDGARLDDAVVRLEQVVRVEGDERHAVAGRDAELDEGVGEPVRPEPRTRGR